MPRRLLLLLAAVALVVVVAVGLSQAGGEEDPEGPPQPVALAEQQAAIRDAPPAIAALYERPNQLVPGGRRELQRRLGALRGTPVVINKWASWCAPCAFEFPFFQRAVTEFGDRVAFLGLNARETGDPKAFLSRRPTAYLSVEDPDERAASSFGAGRLFPATIFIDARGEEHVHTGVYPDYAELEADVRRYALREAGAAG
jgi:cytochrome c biogenesis protein CcmG, thiol:disulfide interchange protein DsbE